MRCRKLAALGSSESLIFPCRVYGWHGGDNSQKSALYASKSFAVKLSIDFYENKTRKMRSRLQSSFR
jgi:hypothetical protein